MIMVFGKPLAALWPQLVIGLGNGAFYALLSLGFAVIFGLLDIVNFTHGALFMLGALFAWLMLSPSAWLPASWGVPDWLGLGYWPALILAPIIVGALGFAIERLLLRRLRGLDPLYGLLLTFGLSLVIEGLARNGFGSSGLPYAVPAPFNRTLNLGFMFLPAYRAWIIVAAIVVCAATWALIEKTSLGAKLRAATENAPLVQAFGVDVPMLISLTYAGGVALAGFAGVLAAPIYSVNPNMGENFIITVFAVVVIGGLGSIAGSVISGFVLGLIEGLTKVYYPEASATVVFVIMVIVLLVRPAGLFGRAA